MVEAEAALGVGDVLAHGAGEEGGHELVGFASDPGHGAGVAHTVADDDGAMGAGVGGEEGGDVGGGVLAVGIHGDGEVVSGFGGVADAGADGGALPLVADVGDDGGPGLLGGVGGGVGGAVVDDDDVSGVGEGFADDGGDVGFFAVGGKEYAEFRDGGGGHGSGGQ